MGLATAIVTAACFANTGVKFAAPVSVNACNEGTWSGRIWRTQRYDCSDGSYTVNKPLGTDRCDDPRALYQVESDSYGSNSCERMYQCTSCCNSEECQGANNNRYFLNHLYRIGW